MSGKGDDYEAAVITDKSDDQSTRKYYNKWSETVRLLFNTLMKTFENRVKIVLIRYKEKCVRRWR